MRHTPKNAWIRRTCWLVLLLSLLGVPAAIGRAAEDFDAFLMPLLAQRCAKCHGEEEVNGEVDFKQIATAKQLLQQPQLIKEVIDVVGANDMPPEGEPQLDENLRRRLLATLKSMLRSATADDRGPRVRIRRLNRFQYNNCVKDLFRLRRDVFPLPEKLMTRHTGYLHAAANKMPPRVEAESHSLHPAAGLREVKPFPKDLRAAHGFDNQANQLTLSPLLLDAFLRLSVSILESPDFNEATVGIWSDFFQQPAAGVDIQQEVRRRLEPFLSTAFRQMVDRPTLDRYTAYAISRMDQGLSFTDSMKKVASAALSSPMFLYRTGSAEEESQPQGDSQRQFELASDLSFFLWASGPDLELLQLAAGGELARPATVNKTIDRLLADPRVERFLDTFPSQWMQLENALAAMPDPAKSRLFRLDPESPASLQMVLEPLLLFDAVFVEDRPIVELIAPKFAYQSDFLKAWYTTDLQPPTIDARKVSEENRRIEQRRTQLESAITSDTQELDALLAPVKAEILAAREKQARENGSKPPLDLRPLAAWEFAGDLRDSIGALDLTAHGEVRYQDGMVVLERAYLLSKSLPIDLRAKSLEVWCKLHNLDQSGGGLMGIQGPGDFFDTIVLGERQPRHWISGSNGFSRTKDFPDSTAEQAADQLLHLVMVYQADGTTRLYRNGEPYGQPYRKGAATFPRDRTSVIFGLRHLPPGGNKYLTVSVDKARLYDRPLTADEVASASSGSNLFVTDKELSQALTRQQQARRDSLAQRLSQSQAELKQLPAPRDLQKLRQQAQQRFEDQIRSKMRSRTFERVAATDPRYGGVITNAAMLSMTSGPTRTHPIARGAWIIEVIFNDPPPPPPNDVPALDEENTSRDLTIREKFAVHRKNPDCAGCHSRLDPLGFALENFDIVGRWRDKYENGRQVDPSGVLLRKHAFDGIVRFKQALVEEDRRFAKAFTGHLLRFALSRELSPYDWLTVDSIVDKAEQHDFKLKPLIREVALSDSFRRP